MSGMVVRELITKWGFNVDQKPLTTMENNIKAVGMSIAVVSAAATAAVGALFGIAYSTARIGEEAEKTGQKVGMTAQQVQALNYAAKQSDIDQGEMALSLQKFARVVMEVRTGSEQATKGMHMMGISTAFLHDRSKTTADMLLHIADIFHSMPDGQAKTAIAMELFGRAGARMIPMLNQGRAGIQGLMSEAEKLGIVMSQDQIKASMKFDESWKRTTSILEGLKIMLGSDLIPIFNQIITKINAWVIANREIIKQRLEDTLRLVEHSIRGVAIAFSLLAGIRILSWIGTSIIALEKLAAAWTTMGWAAFWAQVKAFGIPILIGAAFVLLAAIIDDSVESMFGHKSLFMTLLDRLTEKFPKIGGAIKWVFDGVRQWVEECTTQIYWLYELISKIISIVPKVWDFGKDLLKDVGGKISMIMTQPGVIANPAAALAGGPGGVVQTNHNQISVTVPPGTSTADATKIVREGVSQGFGDLMRQFNLQIPNVGG